MREQMINTVCRALGKTPARPALLSPLVLAYIGDTVFDLYIRTNLLLSYDATAHGLHVMATKRVCAAAQAAGAQAILPELTEQELYIFKRGRNSHMGTVPKNAKMSDYRAATGLEALLGYLYLMGEDDRLSGLMARIITAAEGRQNSDNNKGKV